MWSKETRYVQQRTRSHPKRTKLSSSFAPGPYDVVCARGKEAHNHIGNINFRKKVAESSNDYANAESKMFKSLVVSTVVDWVRANSGPEGGFVKQIQGIWYEVGDAMAREKTGQALREQNHKQYKSSTKAKRRRWKQEMSSSSDIDDSLGCIVRCDKVIGSNLVSMEQRRQQLGGDNAPDSQVLELFTHTNMLILERIRIDPELRRLASQGGNPS